MINYQIGREQHYVLIPAEQVKKLLVVGGGVAGMEFALKAAARGHDVTLWEQDNKLGGQLQYADKAEGKHDFSYFTAYLSKMLAHPSFHIELNKQATTENIATYNPDAVVIATGSLPFHVLFPVRMTNDNVLQANEILSGQAVAGKQVVIIGGGAVGCETAVFIADQATLSAEQVKFLLAHDAVEVEELRHLLNTSSRSVTIVEMQNKTGKDIGISTKWGVKKQMQRLGIKELTNTKVLEVTKTGVLAENAQGEKIFLAADTFVLAIASKAQNQLAEEVKSTGTQTYVIGDAFRPGKIMDAIDGANQLALEI